MKGFPHGILYLSDQSVHSADDPSFQRGVAGLPWDGSLIIH